MPDENSAAWIAERRRVLCTGIMSISAPPAAVGTTTTSVTVGQGPLSIAEVVAVARHDARVVLDPAALDAVAASRTIIDGLAADPAAHYGISTGFGALATTYIESDRRAQLQASLVRSHAAGNPGYARMVDNSRAGGTSVKSGSSIRGGFGSYGGSHFSSGS